MLTITRKPSLHMESGERTFVERDPIDPAKALVQHSAYCAALTSCGLEVETIEADDSLPDCAFVEDCAVTLGRSALICRPGAQSRTREADSIADELSKTQLVTRVQAPATLEGGDVLRLGTRILVGSSCRTNAEGIAALRDWAEPLGFHVRECDVHGCLHLKTACTFLPDGSLIANRNWVDLPRDLETVDAADDEPWAANILLANGRIVAASSQQKTNAMLRRRGFEVLDVDISEFQKAEAGVTCLSILIDPR